MAIAEGLAAKAAIGLGALGAGATGIYFGGDYLINSLSEYDKALIEFLESNKGDYDFVFEVKKGSDNLTESDIAFTTSTNPLKVTVSVQVPDNTNGSAANTLFKKKGGASATDEDAEFTKIKDLNQKKGWTWQCTLEFEKEGGGTTINSEYKSSIFKGTDKGLFGILKKDLSSYSGDAADKWTKDQLKGVKADFIRQCGYSRKLSENKAMNNGVLKDGNVVEANIQKFIFETKTGNELVPKNKGNFEYLFKPVYGTKKYQTET